MPSEVARTDFFISYRRTDAAWADWIAFTLEQAGYTVYYDRDLVAGSDLTVQLKRGLERAERIIAVFSPDYFQSVFTAEELSFAIERQALLPVRVRPCELPSSVAGIVYIDLVGLDEKTAHEALVSGVGGRRRRSRRAVFPSGEHSARFAGALPEIWSVPYRRKTELIGREQDLQRIRDGFWSGRGVGVTQVITGPEGIGKTQLAVEYAYRYATRYDAVWWLNGGEPSALASDYAQLAPKLRLRSHDEADEAASIRAVREWLSRSSGWLLVFDNVPETAACADFLPKSGDGHVLITSPNPDWRDVAPSRRLAPLSREESLAFLAQRMPESVRERMQAHEADSLCELMRGIPIALDLVTRVKIPQPD